MSDESPSRWSFRLVPPVLLVVALLLPLPLSAASPDYLIRATRRGENDRVVLLDAGFHLVAEADRSLLLEGGPGEMARLRDLGYDPLVLDREPRRYRYFRVGLRSDSEVDAILTVGTVVDAGERWLLLRVEPDARLDAIRNARVFIEPISHEKLDLPRSDPGEPLLRRPAGPESAVPLVTEIVNGVKTTDIDTYWSTLVASASGSPIGTRYTTVAGCSDDSAYCYGVYAGLGLAVQYQDYAPSSRAKNVIGTIPGALTPEKVYVVVAHVDDMPESGSAPGANDNASGSVVVLEAARAMSCYAFRSTVKFLNVTGEEIDLDGSSAYASEAASRGENIRAVLNNDMVGWKGDGSPNPENLDLNYDSNSQTLAQLFAQCATDYPTGLAVDPFLCLAANWSDHYPFWQKGYPAVCGITDNEGDCGHGGTYPYYHSSSDTLANCGTRTFFYAVVKGTVATLAELAEPFRVTFDRAFYGASAQLQIVVGDRDLDTSPSTRQSVAVTVSSNAETNPETVTLTEEGVHSMIFRGSFPLTTAAAVHGDGKLSVAAGNTVTVWYTDALDCTGAANVLHTATATVASDGTPPTISNVQISSRTDTTATITWTTNEAADSRVTFWSASPPGTNRDDLSTYVTSHSVTLTGLTSCTRYLFSVTSADVYGNSATDNAAGAFYSFGTLQRSHLFGPDDVESGAGSWTATGQWHIDGCKASSGSHSWKAGSTTCPGSYSDSTTSNLTRGPFALGSAGHGYHLRWSEWFKTETGYDFCRPLISTNGSTFVPLVTAYSGPSGGWISRDADLAAYSGNVWIRFQLEADEGVSDEGWYLDDLGISRSAACPATLPSEASPVGSPLKAREGSGTSLIATYTAGCGATGHVVYWGKGTAGSPVAWSGSACSLGASPASFDPGAVGAGECLQFVVVAQSATNEGSYGRRSSGEERSEAVGIGACDKSQQLGGICP
jgi:hypothetical protein